MYVNRKLFQEWGKNGGGDEFKYKMLDVRTFVNATMYPHSAQ
jgi:hypothetical protein